SLGIVGQTFSGTSGAGGRSLVSRKATLTPQIKWQAKAVTKKGAPKGTYMLKATLTHASLGKAFALAGATGSKTATARIPVNLGVGGNAFASSVTSQFRFGSNGQRASGGGTQ